MFKLEGLGIFLVEGRDLGWGGGWFNGGIRKGCFSLNIMFSGYVYFIFLSV